MRSALLFALIASPLAAQVVVVAPQNQLNPELTISDPYGPCLPDPLRHHGSAPTCIPNPFYRPDFTTATLSYGAPYAPPAVPGAAAAPAAPAPPPLSPLELEAARLAMEREKEKALNMYGTQLRETAMDKLQAALKAQQQVSAQYRAAWPVWSAHWSQVQPRLVEHATALEKAVAAGQVDRGCGAFIGALNETQIALPPAPDYQLVDLHQALFDARTACAATPRDAATIKQTAASMRDAVRVTDEWASGRGAYYASTGARP